MADIPAPPSSRRCPYCAESINSDAVSCRYCGQSLPRDLARVQERGSKYVIGVDTTDSFGVWEQATAGRRGVYPHTEQGWQRAWRDYQTAETGKSGRTRPFTWVIVAINILFLVWVIGGAAIASNPDDCGVLSRQTCESAAAAGAAIGVGIILVIWAVVDVILGVLWLVTRNPTR